MTPITIRFDEAERQALTDATARTGLSAGAIVRLLVRKYAAGVSLEFTPTTEPAAKPPKAKKAARK
jgi:hypothetical protein